MGAFLGAISSLVIFVSLIWLIVNLVKHKSKKKSLLILGAGLILFFVAIAITPDAEPPAPELPAAEAPATEIEPEVQEDPAPPPEPALDAPAVTEPPAEEPAPAEAPAETQFETATVTRVVDGDTIEVRLAGGAVERVRLIGVDTPESTRQVEPYGQEAANFTRSKLSDKTVYLEKDVTDRDRFDRLLRYVWLADPGEISEQEIRTSMFNAVLLLGGYAQVATFPPNVKYVDYFTKFQTEARNANAGLWGIEAAEPEVETDAMFVGSTESDKYHYPDCRWAERINPANLIEFGSSEEARSAGYVPCGTCSPP